MGVHDFHYSVNWEQFEEVYGKYGSQVLNGDGPVFLEGVGRSRARWVKGATQQLTRYCEFFSDNASEHQRRLMTFVEAFSPFFEGSSPPRATYRDPDGPGLAFSPSEATPIRNLAATISISKALQDYEEFLESVPNCYASQTLIWMERYLAAILDFWGDGLPGFGMVYTRF